MVLKGGTMDNVSRSIHLRGQGHDVLRRLLKKISAGGKIEIRKRGTMRIGDRYCFIFGTGFVTNFLEEVYRGGEKGNFRNIQVICMASDTWIFSRKGDRSSGGLRDVLPRMAGFWILIHPR